MKSFFLSVGLGAVLFLAWYPMICSHIEIGCNSVSVLLTTPLHWWVGILVQNNIFDLFGVAGAVSGTGLLVFNVLCFTPFLIVFSVVGFLLRDIVLRVLLKYESKP